MKARRQNYHLKNTYGITMEDYDKLFQKQKGRCVICKKHQLELKNRLVVDHDHETGVIRGLLCYGCNSILGLSGDSRKVLENALLYLEENS